MWQSTYLRNKGATQHLLQLKEPPARGLTPDEDELPGATLRIVILGKIGQDETDVTISWAVAQSGIYMASCEATGASGRYPLGCLFQGTPSKGHQSFQKDII